MAYQMQEVSDPARRAVNPNPKWAVPIELIEWQAAYTQEVLLLCMLAQACQLERVFPAVSGLPAEWSLRPSRPAASDLSTGVC